MKSTIYRIAVTFTTAFIISIFIACDGTKHLADNDLMLVGNHIEATDETFNTDGLQDYILQKPNTKWFSCLKVPLGIYSLSGKDTTKVFNRLMRKWGEAPVALDTSMVILSAENLKRVAFNQGYIDAEIHTEQHVKNRRVSVDYNIMPNSLYTVRNYSYNISDSLIFSLLSSNNILSNSAIKRGSTFSPQALQDERRRISNWLNNQGFRYFNKEMVTFEADTNKNEHLVDIKLNIGLFRRSSTEELHDHPRFYINNIDYETPQGETLNIKYKTLNTNTVLQKGNVYSERDIQKTYNRYSRLQYIKSTNITFQELADSTLPSTTRLLDAKIIISQKKKHSIQIQPEGTNTAGDFGAALSVTYDNLNVFHGCETFSLQARGAFEAIRGLEGYSDNNYEEYGIEARLSFPLLVIPGITRNYRKRHTNTTDFVLSYSLQNRPEFHRRVLRAAWRYNWNNSSGRVGHKIDALDINFVSMPWISPTFKHDYLESNDTRNAILKYNYEDLLILKTGYGITYKDDINYLKFSFETAGNSLKILSSIFNYKKNDEGKYQVANVAFAQYAKIDIDYTHVFRFDERNTLALHSRIGVALPYGNSDIVPYEKRYFSGGANSVRGWGVRELGPGRYKSSDGHIDFINQTGDIRLDFNAELRTNLFWKFQGAIFIDAGNIWTIKDYKDQPDGKFTIQSIYRDLAVAYGIGIRLNFDYFILRLDLGMKAINPSYYTSEEHYSIIHPNFKRDRALHFAVGLPF